MWARVPTDVKATAVAIVLIGMLFVPVHSSGWSFPGFAAFSSTANFYSRSQLGRGWSAR